MRRIVLLLVVMAALLIAGCSEPNVQQDKIQEGMSKKQEEKLNQRIANLEDKVKDQSAEQTTQEAESAKDSALAAAQDYYAAAAGGNYSYTYSNLSAVSQGQFTEDEWVTDNTTLGSDAGTYSVDSVDASTAEVRLTITSADGTSSERFT